MVGSGAGAGVGMGAGVTGTTGGGSLIVVATIGDGKNTFAVGMDGGNGGGTGSAWGAFEPFLPFRLDDITCVASTNGFVAFRSVRRDRHTTAVHSKTPKLSLVIGTGDRGLGDPP